MFCMKNIKKKRKKEKQKKFDIDKVKNLLLQIAKPSCKHCHGTGYIGWNRITNRLVICRCAANKIDKERVKRKIEEIKKRNASKSGNKEKVHSKS